MALPIMHRLLRVPIALQTNARELFTVLSEPGTANGMFTVGMNPSGNGPITHYVSSGLIEDGVATILDKGAAFTFAAYQAKGGAVLNFGNVNALMAVMDISKNAQGAEQVVLGLMGMKPTSG